jgi:hypothetical protein
MNDAPENLSANQVQLELAREQTKRVHAVGWTAGLTAFFSVGAMTRDPTWPMAAGVAALALMVTLVCFAILRRQG